MHCRIAIVEGDIQTVEQIMETYPALQLVSWAQNWNFQGYGRCWNNCKNGGCPLDHAPQDFTVLKKGVQRLHKRTEAYSQWVSNKWKWTRQYLNNFCTVPSPQRPKGKQLFKNLQGRGGDRYGNQTVHIPLPSWVMEWPNCAEGQWNVAMPKSMALPMAVVILVGVYYIFNIEYPLAGRNAYSFLEAVFLGKEKDAKKG